MPVLQTNGPANIYCDGVLADRIVDNVVVKRGHSCTLVDSYVNGNVVTWGARNVTLADTPVRGDVSLFGVTGDVVLGPKGSNCTIDPQFGGNVSLYGDHNVLVCGAHVCKTLTVAHSDGRLTVRASVARRIKVVHNNRFVADGNVGHAQASAIRLYHDTTTTWVVKHNAPRNVLRK